MNCLKNNNEKISRINSMAGEALETTAGQSVVAYIAEYRKKYSTPYETSLRFGSCCIMVRVNEVSLLKTLNEYFKNFILMGPSGHSTPGESEAFFDIIISAHEAREPELPLAFKIKQPDPGKIKIKEEFIDLRDGRIVRKRLTGMHFLFGGGEHLAIGPCLENANQVINFINNRYIEWELCRGALLGHAAAVSWKGKGAAMAGFSGAGKSTLALHMMNHGTTFISNDRLMIREDDQGLTMSGVAKLPRINPGTILNNHNLLKIMSDEEIRIFSALPQKELWELEHKFDASIDECFGPGRFVLEAPMQALAILNWEHNNMPLKAELIDPMERLDLLPAFMKSTGLFFTPDMKCNMPEPSPEAYADHLSHCQVIEFSGGIDFEEASKIYINFLETGLPG